MLIGHSQGTIHLIRLLAAEIEGRPEAARMLSALLIGFNVEVPEGRLVGGTFRTTPLCTRAGQTGCVDHLRLLPRRGAAAGRRPVRPRRRAPATPSPAPIPPRSAATRRAPLDCYWFAASTPRRRRHIAWSSQGPAAGAVPAHPRPGLGAPASTDGPLGYLAITVNADPNDARTDRIPGDVQLAGVPAPGWGLHLVDVNLAMGDLIRAVEAQRDAFLRRRRR